MSEEEDYADDDFHQTKQQMEINVESGHMDEPKDFPKSCANSMPRVSEQTMSTTDHHKAQKTMNFNQAIMSENQQSDKFDSVAHTINDNEAGSKERESNSRAELSAAILSQKSGVS